MRNIFLEKSCRKCVEEVSPKKIKIEHIPGLTVWNVIKFVFILYPSWSLIIYIKSKLLDTWFYLIESFFQKTKRYLELVFLPHFLHDFWRKVFLTLYSINWLNYIVWLYLIIEILGNICIVIGCYPACDVINFRINFSFLIKSFSFMTKNVGQKCKSKKHFSYF